ncbi:ABC transporter permease [Phytoactinopolyspora limicola]|uniref:ABC transporter permease n=1 Tax=Phytoactinopolyspora limicola TaxID=2715536 RepID=UPI00140B5301|nr:ABC transporter permease [Phytoactinopolyspora limicola]
MSAATHTMRDSSTMLRRKFKHMLRYPSMTLQLAAIPIIFLLLFVYVFGGTLGDGLGGFSGGRSEYVNYVTPGVILLAVAATATATAVSVATDMTEGIIARFRTMAIFRPSILTGHVIGSVLQALISLAIVIGAALLIGFRPTAGVVEWFAAAGLLTLLALAITWLAVGLGMVADSAETASNLPTPLILLPFLGSGFVPTESMPGWLKSFADHQPFTPVIETLRGLLFDAPIGNNAWIAVAWCVGITLVCFVWATRTFNRKTL